jgi:hypothetical protein
MDSKVTSLTLRGEHRTQRMRTDENIHTILYIYIYIYDVIGEYKGREDKVYDHVSSSELRTEPEYKDS